MNTHEFRAMNTDWWVRADGNVDVAATEQVVRRIEEQLSRFRPDSALSRLNREREVEDEAVATVLRRALVMRDLTRGAFDPTVGAPLIAAGYARSFEELGEVGSPSCASPGRPHATVEGTHVRLDGPGSVDLGGIAKGWTVDRVARLLEDLGARSYVVDGGGDLRAKGTDSTGQPWPLGVADSHAVRVEGGAVCTSSRRKRRWQTASGWAHHIIDPSTDRPAAGDVHEAVVIAADAATADALATALIAAPARGLEAVARIGASAMVCRDDGWSMTSSMERYLQ
ncbi:MAG: FAD:protein FMN transferase [Dehalococcoidia bacterium]